MDGLEPLAHRVGSDTTENPSSADPPTDHQATREQQSWTVAGVSRAAWSDGTKRWDGLLDHTYTALRYLSGMTWFVRRAPACGPSKTTLMSKNGSGRQSAGQV